MANEKDQVIDEKITEEENMVEENAAEENATEENVIEENSEVEAENADEVEEAQEDSSDGEIEMKKKDKEIKEYVDKLQRTMAEFDNFRKRTIREKSMMYENGAKETLEKLLPIVDNFERAIGSVSDEEKELPFTQGVEMIFKQLMGALDELGVEVIDAEGKEFDPNLHHAVTHAEDEEYDENVVAEVFQKGYMYKEAVLRHSMVKVVN